MSSAPRAGLLERFPALARLRAGARPRHVPWVPQTTETDCGAACLAMALAWFGKQVELDEVRSFAFEGRDGTSARFLVEAARDLGLRARAVAVHDLDDLRHLPRASILHWGFAHFVVLDQVTRAGAVIVDPAGGREHKTREQLDRHFTGVAIALEPAPDFEPQRARPSLGTARLAGELLARSPTLLRVVSSSLLLQLLALALPVLTGLVVDRVVPHGDLGLLRVLVIALCGLLAFRFAAALVRALFLVQLRTDLDARLTLEFLEHLVDLPYAFFQTRSTGDLMMRLNSNATIREMLTGATLAAALDGASASLCLALLLAASPPLGALALVLAAALGLLFLATRRRYREAMALTLDRQARSRSHQVQMFAGIETLKATGAEQRAVERWANLFVDELDASAAQGRLAAWTDALLDALATASPLCVLLAGCHLVLQGSLSLGAMLALNALALGFLGPVAALMTTGLQLETLKSYVARLDDVLGAEKEQPRGVALARPALSGRIRLEGVSFRYGARGPLAVTEVSLQIEPGQFVALVGPSGAGKSTLAHLLLGLYTPTSGQVLFDEHDLAQLDLRWLRRRVGVVTQSPHLFGSSIRDNIALADPGLRLDEIAAAARLAHIHDEILGMPMGYATHLGHGASAVSGGQRQRIALARALVNRPSILLLDEATSNLDALTERRIHDELDRLRCTRIVIAHRLSTVRRADSIVVVEQGRVVESGSYDDLVRRNARFAALVAAQRESAPLAGFERGPGERSAPAIAAAGAQR